MTDNTALITTALMPAMDIGQAVARYQAMNDFVKRILREGVDFGRIPGTGDKPTLLKAGAEKLTSFFGLRPTFEIVEKVEDWTGQEHGGEPFFYFHYRCRLWRAGEVVAEGDGSCNSWESKYRYRKSERICPSCGQVAIIKGKAEYGGGWICFGKKGGCGSKFKDNDEAITGQEVGRVLNPDVADQVNTIQKMGQKRALVAATLIGANASDYFTQDMEDLAGSYVEGEYSVISAKAGTTPEEPAQRPATKAGKPKPNGNGAKASVGTSKWADAAKKLAERVPYYMGEKGPDYHHMLGAAVKLGFQGVTDDNLDEVIVKLEEHANQQANQEVSQ